MVVTDLLQPVHQVSALAAVAARGRLDQMEAQARVALAVRVPPQLSVTTHLLQAAAVEALVRQADRPQVAEAVDQQITGLLVLVPPIQAAAAVVLEHAQMAQVVV
jgi:hypothetical protein